jgi:cell division protein FtsB
VSVLGKQKTLRIDKSPNAAIRNYLSGEAENAQLRASVVELILEIRALRDGAK